MTMQNDTKNFDYTTIADRLRKVSWGKDSHPTGVVKPVPTNRKSRVIKRTHILKFVNNPPYKGRGQTTN